MKISLLINMKMPTYHAVESPVHGNGDGWGGEEHTTLYITEHREIHKNGYMYEKHNERFRWHIHKVASVNNLPMKDSPSQILRPVALSCNYKGKHSYQP